MCTKDRKIIKPNAAFGELLTSTFTPITQIDPTYGIKDKTDVEIFTDGSTGSVNIAFVETGCVYRLSTGTDPAGFAILRSIRSMIYRPGQSVRYRFSARFSDPLTLTTQRAGASAIGNELSFSYQGTSFGILHRTGGRAELQQLTLDTTSSNETATIQLDGVNFDVSITAGTAPHAAFEIGDFSFTGWEVFQNSNTCTFISMELGDKTGAFNLTTTGTLVGSFTELDAGTLSTDVFVSQTAWNGFRLTGNQTDPFTLNQQKGNIYEIVQQYDAYGSVDFNVMEPNSGKFVIAHRIKYPNNNNGPILDIPSMKVGFIVSNTGNASDITMDGGAGSASLEGNINLSRNPTGVSRNRSGIGTTFLGVVSIRVRSDFFDRLNLNEIFPLLTSFAVDGTKPAEVGIFLNPVIGGETNWQFIDQTHSSVEIDTMGVTISSGVLTQEIAGFGLAKSGNTTVNLRGLGIILGRKDVLTIAVRATSGTTDATASVTWEEA